MAEAIQAVAKAEEHLSDELRRVGQRHTADADVLYTTQRLASACHRHLDSLASPATRYHRDVSDDDASPFARITDALRRLVAGMSARSERSGALLLGDLRELNLAAADCNLAWTVLGQGANVHRDQELLEVVYKSQFETGRVIHWIESRTKQTAPQVLSV